jgi:hypothetical protein
MVDLCRVTFEDIVVRWDRFHFAMSGGRVAFNGQDFGVMGIDSIKPDSTIGFKRTTFNPDLVKMIQESHDEIDALLGMSQGPLFISPTKIGLGGPEEKP